MSRAACLGNYVISVSFRSIVNILVYKYHTSRSLTLHVFFQPYNAINEVSEFHRHIGGISSNKPTLDAFHREWLQ